MKVHYPKPKRLKEELGEAKNVEIHRKLDCIYYECCLDHAAKFLYKSFSCLECLYYHKEEKLTKDQIVNLVKLARKILKGREGEEDGL